MNMVASANISKDAQVVPPAIYRGKCLEQTGPYFNDPSHRHILSFGPRGTVSRSFTVLLAVAGLRDGALNFEQNGLVIIDNDNWIVVCDGIRAQPSSIRGPSSDQKKLFREVCAMNWTDFANFCRTIVGGPRGIPDIDTPMAVPMQGNAEQQQRIGVYREPERDNRDDFLRGIHEEGMYSLPFTTRAGMMREILIHPTIRRGGELHLSWDVRMDHAWDRSGRIVNGEELCPSMDGRWKRKLAEDPSILRRALEAVLEGYFDPEFAPLEMDDAKTEIEQSHGEDELFLKSFNGASMGFASHSELRARLNVLTDRALMTFWAAVRVLDADLGRRTRTLMVQEQLNQMRHEIEQAWLDEVDEELSF